MEEWRGVPDFPDYEVSSLGRIRRCTPACGTWVGRVLVPAVQRGYEFVTLCRDKESVPVRVHIAVCSAFHGPRPGPDYDAAHRDGVRGNNAADNLRWATKTENQADRRLHGTHLEGSAVYGAVLTEEAVAEIRIQLRAGRVQTHIAEEFSVSPSTIHLINKGKTWRHVP